MPWVCRTRPDAIDQEAAAELLDGLRGIGRLEQLIEAAVIALLRAHLVGKVGEPHAGRALEKSTLYCADISTSPASGRIDVEVTLLLLLGFGLGVGDLDADRPQDSDVARLAADLGELGVERVAMLLHTGNGAARAELHVGIARGEVHARAGQPGLDDHRPLLRRRQRRQRTAHVEIPAAMVDAVHLCRIGEDAFLTVADDRIFLDAVHSLQADAQNSCART